jgi:hypothetical protein
MAWKAKESWFGNSQHGRWLFSKLSRPTLMSTQSPICNKMWFFLQRRSMNLTPGLLLMLRWKMHVTTCQSNEPSLHMYCTWYRHFPFRCMYQLITFCHWFLKNSIFFGHCIYHSSSWDYAKSQQQMRQQLTMLSINVFKCCCPHRAPFLMSLTHSTYIFLSWEIFPFNIKERKLVPHNKDQNAFRSQVSTFRYIPQCDKHKLYLII